MTSKKLLEPIDREKARQQWNCLMKRRTMIRRLSQKYPTPQYHAKLEVYKDFFHDNLEITKIVVQYLKGLIVEKEEAKL